MAVEVEEGGDSCAAPKALHFGREEEEEEEDQLFSIAVHPSSDVLATGTINGNLQLVKYEPGSSCVPLHSANHHPGRSCRVLRFSRDGDRLFTGSSGKGDIFTTDSATGKLSSCIRNAHSVPLYSMHVLSQRLLASGDENGTIKLWDTRTSKPVLSLKENSDFISDMTADTENKTILATSGDGSLVAVDVRQRRLEQRSDCTESELLSLAIVKRGTRVVCGDGEGSLMLYHWGLWGDITDRFPGHPGSVDALLALSDDVLCTGCTDGRLRAVHVLPNQELGTFGEHTAGFPINGMCLTHDHAWVVTSSYNCCHFWPQGDIPKLPLGKGEGGGGEGGDGGRSGRRKRKRKQKQRDLEDVEKVKQSRDDFFSDLCN